MEAKWIMVRRKPRPSSKEKGAQLGSFFCGVFIAILVSDTTQLAALGF